MPIYCKSICYYCGNPSTSTEHAPPKIFFRGFSCDSITAPSCDAHNSNKSNDDQSIASALIQSLNNIQVRNGSSFSPEIQKAIEITLTSIEYTKKRVKNVDVIEKKVNLNLELPQVTHLQGEIDPWIKQITAVLVWDSIKYFDKSIDWNKAIVNHTNWIPTHIIPENLDIEIIGEFADKSLEVLELEKTINWVVGWSADPKPSSRDLPILF